MLEKAKAQGLRYVSIRVRTEKEIRQYLLKKGYSTEIIDQVIAYLYSYNYLDDMKFCELWIEDRIRLNPCGKKKIYHELRQKGVASELINEALDLFCDSEIERELAIGLARKKREQGKDNSKIENFLQYRGFPYDIITDAIEKTDNDGINERCT